MRLVAHELLTLDGVMQGPGDGRLLAAGHRPDDTVGTRLNAAPKHVVSTTLSYAEAPWANTASVIADGVAEPIRTLKGSGDGELQVHGSWQLLQTLLAERLVDELRLVVAPTVIGEGKRVFERARPSGFEVTDARVAPNGCVAMTLVPAPFRTASFEVVDGRERLVGEQSTDA